MTLDPNLRVGINNTSPSATLDVNGGSDNLLATFKSTDDLAYISFQDNNTTSNTSVALGANDNNLVFFTGTTFGSERMRITSAGNVGIGTTLPGAKFTTSGVIMAIANDNAYNAGYFAKLSSDHGANALKLTSRTGDVFLASNFGSSVTLQVGNPNVPALYINASKTVQFNGYDSTNQTGTPTYLLGTDASGNIVKTNTVPGSGAGPYLPLSAGPSKRLTGSLYIDNTSPIIVLNDTNATVPTDAIGYISFQIAGSEKSWLGWGSNSTNDFTVNAGAGSDLILRSNNVVATYFDSSQNATFTGNVTADGSIQILDSAANLTISGDTGGNAYYINSVGRHRFRAGGSSVNSMEISSTDITLNEPVTATSTVTATTFLGDLNGTINTATTAVTQVDAVDNDTVATTAYVNNKIALIPAGLVFQGTWNAATNTPTLTSGSGTTGNFYIVSTPGSTNLDGITDWKTGDWAVFIEQGVNDQWEKIDNSSVLDGIGTGGRVTKWSGSGTSNTLTDSGISDASNAIAITINGNEEVGIGGSPFHKLDVYGTLRVSGQVTFGDDLSVNDSARFEGTTNPITIGDGFGYGGSATICKHNHDIYLQYNNGQTATNVRFGGGGTSVNLLDAQSNNYNISGTGNSWFNGGNVGIGTSSPGYKLDVNGTLHSSNITLADGIYHEGDTNTYINFLSDTIQMATAGSVRAYINSSGNVGIGTTTPNYKLTVSGGINAGGVVTYSKVAGSLNTTGYAIAGLGTVFNGASAFFTFTASGGTGQYQRVVYSCAGVGTNWVVYKVIDEGTNVLDIEASATSAATIVFTFKTRSGTQAYSPRVVIQASGHSIISTYA